MQRALYGSVLAALLAGCAMGQDCLQQNLARAKECRAGYTDFFPDKPATFMDLEVFASCLVEAIEAERECRAGIVDDPREALWEQLRQNLAICRAEFAGDAMAQRVCAHSALREYMRQIRSLPDRQDARPGRDCDDLHAALERASSWRLAKIVGLSNPGDRFCSFLPVTVDTRLPFNAGFSPPEEGDYDIAQAPCITDAAFFVAYSTPDNGSALSLLSVGRKDHNKGFRFESTLPASLFVAAEEVTAIVMYLDQHGDPQFVETALLRIQPSPVPGDWNRDGVKDNQDLVDFTAQHAAGVPRTDLNGDGVIDAADFALFLDEYNQ